MISGGDGISAGISGGDRISAGISGGDGISAGISGGDGISAGDRISAGISGGGFWQPWSSSVMAGFILITAVSSDFFAFFASGPGFSFLHFFLSGFSPSALVYLSSLLSAHDDSFFKTVEKMLRLQLLCS